VLNSNTGSIGKHTAGQTANARSYRNVAVRVEQARPHVAQMIHWRQYRTRLTLRRSFQP
jgi:hypothetical protein